MNNLKELSFEEMVEVDGGWILTGPLWITEAVYEFGSGFAENIGPAFERAFNNIKYQN
ncbi:hypothetical protein P872_16870 [Rhodonellum psychrophilum GCM71 = DSM 17998]|uniref:Bacteriocin n=2 Tax=Rhodonellum TaxID=336827 RepID=U5BRI5_9BACT|nr:MULTISPECIES: class IIb bacteriocin, lactobin A/cerein 7B family [Rhodonellum]ERM83195.1 hypothetical protein P872_16870 [Rhodonellum psychrophilum GCM71 = DSM 17998]SDZ14526.1 class IIb bacteriocin, lactobin A/cerein 7B family [Rhodonellum ikkaensis]